MKIQASARNVDTLTADDAEARAREVLVRGGRQPGAEIAIVGRFYFSPRRYSYGFRFGSDLGVPRELDGGTWFVPERAIAEQA